MKKLIGIVLALVMLTAIFTGCTEKKDDELVVGMELAYPPFETTDEEGNPTGISVEMAMALGEFIGRPVRIENMSYAGLVPALQTNKVDIVISSMTITDERLKVVNFSDPYAKAQLGLLVYADSPVMEFDDLKEEGMMLAVKKGTSGHFFALANLPEENVVVFEKETGCVLEVTQGKADAFIYDVLTIHKNNTQYPDVTRAVFTPFQEEYEYWGMAIGKEDADLLNSANEFIADFQAKGAMNDLADKYLTEIKTLFDEMDLPFFFEID